MMEEATNSTSNQTAAITTTPTSESFMARFVLPFVNMYSNNTTANATIAADDMANDTTIPDNVAAADDDTCEMTNPTLTNTTTYTMEGASTEEEVLALLELGKEVLDSEPTTSSSVWVSSSSSSSVVVGDAGLSKFDEALKLANCQPWNEVYESIVNDGKAFDEWSIDFVCSEIYYVQGRAYMKLKQYGKSLSSLQSALAILESTVGRYHPLTGFVYLKMGLVYETMAAIEEPGRGGPTMDNNNNNNMDLMAKAKYLVALQIERKLFGEDGPWNVPNTIGSLMKDRMGKSEEQVARKISSAENWLHLELLGDEQAEWGETNVALGFYREAIHDERRTEALNNANAALLFRKLILPGEDTFDSFVPVNTADAGWKMKSLGGGGGGSYCDAIKLGDAMYLNGNYTGAIGYYKLAAHDTPCFPAAALGFWMLPAIMFIALAIGFPLSVYCNWEKTVGDPASKIEYLTAFVWNNLTEFFWNISQLLRKRNEDNHSGVQGEGVLDGEGQAPGTSSANFVTSLIRFYESMKRSEKTSPSVPSDESPQGSIIIQEEATSAVKASPTPEGNNPYGDLVHQGTGDLVVDDEDTDPGHLLSGSLLSLGAAMARTQKEEGPSVGSLQSSQEDMDGIVVQRCSG